MSLFAVPSATKRRYEVITDWVSIVNTMDAQSVDVDCRVVLGVGCRVVLSSMFAWPAGLKIEVV